jgi:hypothetical protein
VIWYSDEFSCIELLVNAVKLYIVKYCKVYTAYCTIWGRLFPYLGRKDKIS